MKIQVLLAPLLTLVAVALAGKIDPSLQNAVTLGLTSTAILELPQVIDQVKSNPSHRSLSGDAKVASLVASLRGLTSAAQAPHVAVAASLGLETKQYWISNVIVIRGVTLSTLSQLASTPGEFTLREQGTAQLVGDTEPIEVNVQLQNPQWGVAKIRAPAVHNITQGEGIVVGIIDTGVNLGHVALAAGYAGAWLDPYDNTPGPTDYRGHGSHVAGTVLGRANGVGVAPAAQWTACRGFGAGSGVEEYLLDCGQFMVTSTPRPHIVCNSWAGGQGNPFFRPAVDAWREAGLIPVFAMGNYGPSCGSVMAPASFPNVIGVGGTNDVDGMYTSSNRGPTTTGLLKPDVSAPAVNVLSCGMTANDYVTMTGTSMACPHVSGAIALLLSANPTFTYDDVYAALTTSAVHPPVTNADKNCGLPGPGDFPNQAYGHGRIDIAAAFGL